MYMINKLMKLLNRIQQLVEVAGVQCQLVDPIYIHKLNKYCEIFVYRNCGYKSDSDFVGATNILKAYLTQQSMVAGRIKSNFINKITNYMILILNINKTHGATYGMYVAPLCL